MRFDQKNWIAFLDRCGLWGDAEVTNGKIYHRAIFEDQDDGGAYTARMPLLRVGKVRPGNSPPSNTAINSGIEPPRLTHAMREAKMKLIKATMRLLVIDEAKQDKILLQ